MISHLFLNGMNHNYTNEFEKYNRDGMYEGMVLLLDARDSFDCLLRKYWLMMQFYWILANN